MSTNALPCPSKQDKPIDLLCQEPCFIQSRNVFVVDDVTFVILFEVVALSFFWPLVQLLCSLIENIASWAF